MDAYLEMMGFIAICLIAVVILMMIVSTYFTVNELNEKIKALDAEVHLSKCRIKRMNKKKDKKKGKKNEKSN